MNIKIKGLRGMGKGGGERVRKGRKGEKTLFSTIACLVWYFFIFLFNLFSFIFVGRERKETEKKGAFNCLR